MSEGHHTKEQQIPIYVWIIAGLILLIAGWFGFKMLISPFQEYRATLVNGPKEVFAGSNAAFTWRIDGPAATIHSTVVYLGTTSNPGELGKDVKPADTRYTEFVKDFANGNYNVPLQFVGNISLTNPGTYYYRIYATANEKHYWSDEYTMEVKAPTASDYGVELLYGPTEGTAGDPISFTWRVNGPPTTIPSTQVFFGPTSEIGKLDLTKAPSDTAYIDSVKDFANGNYNIPLQFVGNGKIATPGAYFYRVHAQIKDQHYWTDERSIEIKKKITPTITPRGVKKQVEVQP